MIYNLSIFSCGILKDINGDYSAKRLGFLVILALLSACTIGGVFFSATVPPLIFNGLVDLCGWFLAAILGEHTPAALAAWKGVRQGENGAGEHLEGAAPVDHKPATLSGLDDPNSILNRGK